MHAERGAASATPTLWKSMNGSVKPQAIRIVLVIGIHHKELIFGRQVAESISMPGLRVIQIDNGLRRQDAFKDKGFYYSTYHREIYLQLHQQIRKKCDLLIDLHTGSIEQGVAADIYCGDPVFLDRLKKSTRKNLWDSPVYLLRIVEENKLYDYTDDNFKACHTIIPKRIWSGKDYLYAGLEIYLSNPIPCREDVKFAVWLISVITDAGQYLRNSRLKV